MPRLQTSVEPNQKKSGNMNKYAKLTIPRLHDAMLRPRLFSLLDKLFEQHAVVWVVSPPGAGKTTLAASYLRHRDKPSIWYQVDELDGDSGTLFFFLSEASNGLMTMRSLPHGDNLKDAAKIDRLYFRDFYAHLPPDTTIVFDNMQDFDWNNASPLMESALSEVPEGISLLILSREAPPARFSRMQLDGKLAVLGWNDISMNQEEAVSLAGLNVAQEPVDTHWLSLVDGWAAGIVMLRNLDTRSENSLRRFDGRDELFQYFAGEIFERMPRSEQQLLLTLSVMTGTTDEDAIALSKDSNAPQLLKNLYYKSLFIDRRGTAPYSYHFHALFQEFLRHEFNLRMNAQEQTALQDIAARLYEEKGRIEDAVLLYQKNGNFKQLATMLVDKADLMLRNGRGQIWRDWMSAIPPSVIADVPELWYWQGMFLNELAPRQARVSLLRAENAFQAPQHLCLRLLSVAAIVEGYDAEGRNFEQLAPWIPQIRTGLDVLDTSTIAPETALLLYSRLLLALLLVSPESGDIPNVMKRVIASLNQVTEPTERLSAGAILLRVVESGLEETSVQINWLLQVMQDCTSAPSVHPFKRVKWLRQLIRWHQNNGNLIDTSRFVEEVKNIVTSSELDPLLAQLIEIEYLIGAAEVSNSRQLLDQMQALLPATQAKLHIEFQILDAKWHSLTNDMPKAINCLMAAQELSHQLGVPKVECARLEIFLAACHAQLRDFVQAENCCQQALQDARGFEALAARESQAFIRGYAQICLADDAAAIPLLADALLQHQQRQGVALFPTTPLLAAQLADFALKNSIATAHVHTIIVRQKLSPPDKLSPCWPWPVAVRIFGKFELQIDGNKLKRSSSGGGQHKLLMLLKALICAGDKGVALKSIAAQLWPDSETARTTLNVTVHRLRKLLGGDDRVIVMNGNMFVAESKIWSDMAAIAHTCHAISELPAPGKPGIAINMPATSTIVQLGNQLLALYSGPLCAEDNDAWLLIHRDRWASRFANAVTQLGACLENAAEWTLASQLYQRALDVDALAEASYRGLMRCAHAENDQVAAINVYRRCREVLSIVVGLPPSAETSALAKKLGLIIGHNSPS
jgi:DNA-binding SARP family transcriptional activator